MDTNTLRCFSMEAEMDGPRGWRVGDCKAVILFVWCCKGAYVSVSGHVELHKACLWPFSQYTTHLQEITIRRCHGWERDELQRESAVTAWFSFMFKALKISLQKAKRRK